LLAMSYDIAIIGWHLTQETWVQNALDDVASKSVRPCVGDRRKVNDSKCLISLGMGCVMWK
jgi:hypothetical protein